VAHKPFSRNPFSATSRWMPTSWAFGIVMPGVLLTALAAPAEEPRYAEWRLVEAAPATIEYRNSLRNGVFDDNARSYLRDVALPQLALPANRAAIDRVRRRLRDIACDPSGDPRALEQAGQFVIDFMKIVAADEKADAAARVNALLLIGDLNAKGGRPLPAALAPLTAVVADGRQPAAVRIAAAAGLSRHVQDSEGKLPPPVVATLVKLVTDAADSDPVAAEWLKARALGMLSMLGSAVPREAVAAAAAILGDASAPTDTRVRAAAVVGAAAADAGVDVARTIATIRDLAVKTLAAEAARDEPLDLGSLRNAERSEGTQPTGFPGQEGPAGQQPVQMQACRRAAWRLDTLATALGGVDGQGGLAVRAGPAQRQIVDLAAGLRDAAMRIDENPDVISIREALDALTAVGAPTAAPQKQQPDSRPSSAPAGDAPFNPFGQ